jgi:hypothetical protein
MYLYAISSLFMMAFRKPLRKNDVIVSMCKSDRAPDTGPMVHHIGGNTVRQFAAVQLFGYCFRQRLYNELLNDGRIIDTIQHHPADIWYLVALPTMLMLLLRDPYKRRSFEKLRELYLSREMKWIRIGEFIALVTLIIFTKDVESVL